MKFVAENFPPRNSVNTGRSAKERTGREMVEGEETVSDIRKEETVMDGPSNVIEECSSNTSLVPSLGEGVKDNNVKYIEDKDKENSVKHIEDKDKDNSVKRLEGGIKKCSNNKAESNLESWVKLRMTMDSEPSISEVMLLKSTATVLRAMKKFSTIVSVSYRKLEFYWLGETLTGTELAGSLEGAVVVVRSKVG